MGTLTHTERAEIRALVAARRTERRHAEQAERAERYEQDRRERGARADVLSAEAERHDARSADLAERRRLHLVALTHAAHVEERDALRAAHTDALRAAADSATKVRRERKRRERERELVAARQRDEWKRAHALAPMTPYALLALTVDCAENLGVQATEDERSETVAWALARIGARHGFAPSATDVERSWVKRIMRVRILDERKRIARRNDSRAWEAVMSDWDDSGAGDEGFTRDDAIRNNVWHAFQAPALIRSASAAGIGADYLADALGIAGEDERLALTAGLSESHRQAPALAAALGISESATRKRLERGRSALRERWQSASDLVAEVASVQAAESEREYVQLTAAERGAADLVDVARQRTYALTAARVLTSAPVGCGRWHEGLPALPANRAAWADSERAARAEGFAERFGALLARSAEHERVTPRVALRRSADYRQRRLWGQGGESVRALMLAAIAAPADSAPRVLRMTTPSAGAAGIGSVADTVASARALRRSALAAVYRERLALALMASAQRVIRRKWLCTLAARRVGALLTSPSHTSR